MAKQNFVNQLAKGFIRSAVNQVGRDGGRVISNHVYNGQNYVPVAGVNPVAQPSPCQPASIPPTAELATKEFSGGKIAVLALASFLFSVFGSLAVLIYGALTYCKKTDKVKWYESVPQYAADRRYKTGERYIGDATVKRQMTVAASPESIQIHKRNGTAAMIVGGIGILLYVIFMAAALLSR